MSDKQPAEPKQHTPKGHEIPVPKRKEVLDFLKGVTGKAPVEESAKARDTPDSR